MTFTIAHWSIKLFHALLFSVSFCNNFHLKKYSLEGAENVNQPPQINFVCRIRANFCFLANMTKQYPFRSVHEQWPLYFLGLPCCDQHAETLQPIFVSSNIVFNLLSIWFLFVFLFVKLHLFSYVLITCS